MAVLPKSRVVWVLIIAEAFKAAAHTSVAPLLTAFFMDEFGYGEELASAIVSGLGVIQYLTCIPGGLLGDTYLGRYKTMYLVAILAVVMMALFSVTAFTFVMALRQAIFYIGLLFLATTYGFNRANTFAFTAEQYRPDQKKEHDNAITYIFIFVNLGGTISMVACPILRNMVGCFGQQSCYQIPWFTFLIIMVLSLLMFMFALKGVNKEQIREPNSIYRVCKCIGAAFNSDENAVAETKEQYLERNPDSIDLNDYVDDEKFGVLDSWLDNAYPKFPRRFIFDVRQLFRLALIFLPFILFWSAWFQQMTSWTIQGRYSDGRLWSLVVGTELLYASNPILCVVFVMLLSFVVYPLLEKRMNLTPLRRIGTGIAITAVSLVCSTAVWFAIYSSMEKPSEGKAFVFDFTNCSLQSSVDGNVLQYGIRSEQSLNKEHIYEAKCRQRNETFTTQQMELKMEKMEDENGWVFARGVDESLYHANFEFEGTNAVLRFLVLPDWRGDDSVDKESFLSAIRSTEEGERYSHLHFFNNGELVEKLVADLPWTNTSKDSVRPIEFMSNFVSPEKFTLAVGKEECKEVGKDCKPIGEIEVRERLGGTYAILVHRVPSINESGSEFGFEVHELVAPAKISILTQIPQFTLMALGESMISHTGLQFAYSQASPSMKSVINSMNLICPAIGNLINMGILGIKFTENHMIKSAIYIGLLVLDLILFLILSKWYTYIDVEQPTPIESVKSDPSNNPQSSDTDGSSNVESQPRESSKSNAESQPRVVSEPQASSSPTGPSPE